MIMAHPCTNKHSYPFAHANYDDPTPHPLHMLQLIIMSLKSRRRWLNNLLNNNLTIDFTRIRKHRGC